MKNPFKKLSPLFLQFFPQILNYFLAKKYYKQKKIYESKIT